MAQRVLLLSQADGNRELLVQSLSNECEVLLPDGGDALPEFDLCVVDAASFVKWRPQLVDAKLDAEPVFLPVMLILPRAQVGRSIERYCDAVDEFVVTPINRHEFDGRVRLLLRARNLAMTQQSHLAYIANHDRATGLPNAHLFADRLANAIRDASIVGTTVYAGVVAINLTPVVESLGKDGVERVVGTFSRRLRGMESHVSTVARLSDDRWGLIFPSGSGIEETLAVCRDIAGLLKDFIKVRGERLYATAAIGIASFPDDADDAAGLLDAANAALSQSRDGEPAFYSPLVRDNALRYLRTEARLREAVIEEQFDVFFQPRLDLVTYDVTSAEALVRWRLPGGEYVRPDQFIPVAESTGLIRDIDRWVLQKACRAAAGWRRDGDGPGGVSVNITPIDVRAEDFVETVTGALEQAGLPPSALELELTESMLFELSADNLLKLETVREAGVVIAVDDFGKGYSSLGYLHELPINVLKIDRIFINDILQGGQHEAIVRTIVWLAKNFELHVVAEGVELVGQALRLRELECGLGQGFLFSKPRNASDFSQAYRAGAFEAPLKTAESSSSSASK